jgi:hypothetical protein
VSTEAPFDCYLLSLADFDALAVKSLAMKIELLEYFLRILTARLRRANDLIGQLAS